jgi:secreted trypsin-like serine protease
MKFRQLTIYAILLILILTAGVAGASGPLSSRTSLRIVGGTEAEPGDWPWMTALIDSSDSSPYSGFICGGSLIHPRWVVTAAHCVNNDWIFMEWESDPEDIDVLIGAHDLTKDEGQRIKIKRIITHPEYNSSTHDSDIALLELEEDALYSPLALVSENTALDGKDAVSMGWGLTDPYGDESPEKLRQVSLPIVSNARCRESYGDEKITDNMVCAGYSQGGRDTCQGDSGGPLIVQEGNIWELAGVVSWGNGCAKPGYYGVYTRVSGLLEFIYEYVSDLTLTLPEYATEGDGILSIRGIVTLQEASESDLLVTLSSDRPSEVSVPASVAIPAGSIKTSFAITVLDDTLLDGTQHVTITASGSGGGAASGTISVKDNEIAALTISVPENVSEGDGMLTNAGTVTVSRSPDADISVSLSSDDTSEISVPETVIIPAGQTSARFDIKVVQDGIADVTQTVTITAAVEGWTPGNAVIRVAHYQSDFFTEDFDWWEDNDLAYQTLTFTPDGSKDFYIVCREEAFDFPTDPSNGTSLWLWDDDYEQISLSGAAVSLYGKEYSSFYVGSNGYITFSRGDTNAWESLSDHFDQPRISGLFADLDPDIGSISWKQQDDRITVTWQDVPEFSFGGGTGANSFQIEMFFSGVIRITYLNISENYGIAGLSEGFGQPEGFIESDLSSYDPCGSDLSLNLPESAAEGSGILRGRGTVRISSASEENIIVSLTSDDTSELTVPEQITIRKGQQSASFDLTLPDDSLLDGPQIVTVKASAPGYDDSTDKIHITDDETAVLSLNIPQSVSEGDGILLHAGTLTISSPPDEDIAVSLTSDDAGEITVPETVVISAGETSVLFDITVVQDGEDDGDQTVSVNASVTGWASGTAVIEVAHYQPDFFTEEFDWYNDLAYQSLTFRPDGSEDVYSMCREQVSDFFSDPSDATPLDLGNDDYDRITLSGGATVSLYGTEYSSFYVGSNGYITFDRGDTEGLGYLPNHFCQPRISGLFTNLIIGKNTLTWEQQDDRAVITWLNAAGSAGTNSFQIEMFFSGLIRITYLDMSSPYGIAGLSQGKGIPQSFFESDLSSYGDCGAPLFLEIPPNAAEGDGILGEKGIVRIDTALDKNLSVSLASGDVSELTVPTQVSIEAGQTAAGFDITILDDTLLDGPQTVTLIASAAGYDEVRKKIRISDNETAVLKVNLPENIYEGDTLSGGGTVSLSRPPDIDISVSLTSDDTGEITVPQTVIIPAGQTAVSFDITAIQDEETDNTQQVEITASMEGWTSGSETIDVLHRAMLKALYFIDHTEGVATDPVATALENKQYIVKIAYSYSNFETLIPDEEWDMVILMNQISDIAHLTQFTKYIAERGKAVMADWSGNEELGTAFGVIYTGNKNKAPVTITDASLAEGLTNPLPLSSNGYATWAVGMSSAATVAGTFPGGDAAVVIGNEGRTAALGFVNGTISDDAQAVRFYENLISIIDGSGNIQAVSDFFTESFEGDNDLAYQTLTFTPDGSENFYRLCRDSAEGFPSNPAGGERLIPADDSYEQITLSRGKKISFYGTEYASFYVGTGGYVTFESGDSDEAESLQRHFEQPRISGLFANLFTNLVSDGTLTWKQSNNSVLVTWQDVKTAADSAANSFQIEILFSGAIRISYLNISSDTFIAGLSRGNRMPATFAESDLSSYFSCDAGDADGNGILDLKDPLMILKVLAGETVIGLYSGSDMNGDEKIGIEELIFVLKTLAHQAKN